MSHANFRAPTLIAKDRMFRHTYRVLAAALSILAVQLSPGCAQDIDILLALPAETLTFSASFIADDVGFYKKEGLKVSTHTLVGVNSPNAVIAGSADFTIGTGPVFLRAAAAGQRLLAIANLLDRPLIELVLSKQVADAAGFGAYLPLSERSKALKDKTIAVQGVGSIVHAWERLVVHRAGLDIEKDVRIAPMDPSNMLAAMAAKSIDGFATSPPYTTEAVLKGSAVMLATGAHDAPDLLPFAYGLLYTRSDTCSKQRDKCMRIVRALAAANKFILEKPGEA